MLGIMRTTGMILLFFAAGGCAGRSETPAQSDSVGDDAACKYSSAFDIESGNDVTPGCHVVPGAQSCQASDGAKVSSTGVSDGTETCKPVCPTGRYAVSCVSDSALAPTPELPPGAGCQLIAEPTPSNELSYCCQCGN